MRKYQLLLFTLLFHSCAVCQLIVKATVTNPNCGRSLGYHNPEDWDYIVVSDGSIIFSVSGGTPPYSFYFSNPIDHTIRVQNNGFFPQLGNSGVNGSYFFIIRDAAGLRVDTSIDLTSTFPEPRLDGYIFLNHNSTCTSSDASFAIRGSGGTHPYLFSGDGGLNYNPSDTFKNLAPGLYSYFMKDSNGCIAGTGLGTILNYPTLNCSGITLVFPTSACNNDGIAYTHILETELFHDSLPFVISYDDTVHFRKLNKPISPKYEDSASGLAAGFHFVYLKNTVTGYVSIATFTVAKSCYVYIDFVAVDASCNQSDGILTVKVLNGKPPFTYTIDGINYQSSNVFTGLASGSYSVGVRDANGEKNSAIATVFNKCPVISAITYDDHCNTGKGAIKASGIKGVRPYKFSIDNNIFVGDSLFTGLGVGTYKIILRDANGFEDSTYATIGNNCLLLSTVASNEACNKKNGSINAFASGEIPPYTYSIDGINFQSNSFFQGLPKGIYYVTAKDAVGIKYTITDTIVNIPGPNIKITSSKADCEGGNGRLSIATIGGIAPYQFSTDSISYQADSIFQNLNSGWYKVVVKDSGGCVAGDTTRILKDPKPVFSIGNDTTVCFGQTVLLKAPSGTQFKNQWQDNSTADTYMVNNTGQYFLKVTNQFNCTSADTINVIIKPLPIFSLGNDTSICTGKSLNFKVTLTGATYLWNTGSTLSSLLVNSPGLYWLKVTDGGCSKTDSMNVTYKPSPIVNLGKDSTLCEGQILQLNAGNLGTTYVWQDNSTAAGFNVSKEGMYFVSANKAGCIVADTINVAYRLKPLFTLGPDQLICQGQVITLQPSNNENWQLRWQDGSSKSSIQITQPGLYSLAATNTCGTSNDEVLFTKGLCKVYIPNAFSPNGDTKNDVFKVYGTDALMDFHLQIFNRYGQLVFETTDKNKGWDGTVNNAPAVNGNYVYILQYKETGTSVQQVFRGSCLLIK